MYAAVWTFWAVWPASSTPGCLQVPCLCWAYAATLFAGPPKGAIPIERLRGARHCKQIWRCRISPFDALSFTFVPQLVQTSLTTRCSVLDALTVLRQRPVNDAETSGRVRLGKHGRDSAYHWWGSGQRTCQVDPQSWNEVCSMYVRAFGHDPTNTDLQDYSTVRLLHKGFPIYIYSLIHYQ